MQTTHNLLEERVNQAVHTAPTAVAEVVAETLEAAQGAGVDSAQTIVLVRGIRALIRLVAKAPDQVVSTAFASTDLETFVSLLQDPMVQALLSEHDPFARAKIRGLTAQSKLLAAEGGCISSHKVADLIGLTPQAVDKARKKGQYLAFPRGQNRYAYPAWQFDQGHALKGLKDVLQALGDATIWTKAAFLLGEDSRLDNRRPLDLLRQAKVGEVLAAARSFGEHGAA
jgi:hypothetical protein